MHNTRFQPAGVLLILAAGAGFLSGAAAQQSPQSDTTPPPASRHSPFRSERMQTHARQYYAAIWGVENLRLNYTSSGNLIRFSYKVTDPTLAKVLADKGASPVLISPKKNIALEVPVMDKIGQLRQTPALKAGQEYWMVFSNKGDLVRPGDRVNLVVGSFHAEGLMVQ